MRLTSWDGRAQGAVGRPTYPRNDEEERSLLWLRIAIVRAESDHVAVSGCVDVAGRSWALQDRDRGELFAQPSWLLAKSGQLQRTR